MTAWPSRASPSSAADTVTVRAVFHVLFVNDSVFWLPPVCGSVSTVRLGSPSRDTVTVTVAVGGLVSLTV